jgi:hypothetical protein
MPITPCFSGSLPKQGESDTSCEDRFALSESPLVRATVVDGASDGIFVSEWADLLAHWFLTLPTLDNEFTASLSAIRQQWAEQTSMTPLPWYMQAKRRQGAAGALVGIQFTTERGWLAIAVGDSCLFQMRGNSLITAFPVETADDFNSIPPLLHTDPQRSGERYARKLTGTFHTGDTFYLMSDALAAWFLREWEQGRNPTQWLGETLTKTSFAERIKVLRESGRLRNDDTTLVLLRAD